MVFCGYVPSSGIAGSYAILFLVFFKEYLYCSPQWLYQFTFPPTVQEGSTFFIPSPVLTVCRYFYDGHSDVCEVLPDCSFGLNFSNN